MNRFGISYGLVFCFSYFSCHSSIAAFSFHFSAAWHSFLLRLPLVNGPTHITAFLLIQFLVNSHKYCSQSSILIPVLIGWENKLSKHFLGCLFILRKPSVAICKKR
jgi:hypothetical protein